MIHVNQGTKSTMFTTNNKSSDINTCNSDVYKNKTLILLQGSSLKFKSIISLFRTRRIETLDDRNQTHKKDKEVKQNIYHT